jgi:sugar lactone lactonase YvrE
VTQVELVLDAKAELAEGPCWLADRERLLWVDIKAGHVHLFDPATGSDRFVEVGQPVGAAVPADDGRLALAVRDGFAMLDLETGRTEPVADVEREVPGNRMNDGKCDSAGRFWAGTMATPSRRGQGALYRLEAGRGVERMVGEVGISNGLGWSPDDRLMYYIDTLEGRVDVFDFDAGTGSIANRRPFAVIERPGHPDGMTMDADGGLWVALWGGGRVVHYLPDGTLRETIEIPVAQPSSCAFGGPDLRDLYITSAWQDLTPDQRRDQPAAGGLFRCRPGVAGAPTRPYRTK